MKMALAIILCAVLIQFQLPAQYGGEYRISGYQEPDYAAAKALADAMAAYQALQLQQQREEAQAEALQQRQQAEEAERQQQIHDQLEALRQTAAQKVQDAALAETSVSNLIASTLQSKKLIPADPWRQILGLKTYVKSPYSGFVKFDGKILQTTTNGILVTGIYKDAETNFFVEHFPYQSYGFSVDDYLSEKAKTYVARPDGTLTYIDVNNSIQTIPKLDYGDPCPRPQDADTIETAAAKLSPDEEQQISNAEQNAKDKANEAVAAVTSLKAFIQQIEDEAKARIEAHNAPQNKALKYDQDQAAKGDPYGLLRMGERCRDGESLPKDLTKAREYFTKAANAGSPTAADELKRLNQSSAVNDTATPK